MKVLIPIIIALLVTTPLFAVAQVARLESLVEVDSYLDKSPELIRKSEKKRKLSDLFPMPIRMHSTTIGHARHKDDLSTLQKLGFIVKRKGNETKSRRIRFQPTILPPRKWPLTDRHLCSGDPGVLLSLGIKSKKTNAVQELTHDAIVSDVGVFLPTQGKKSWSVPLQWPMRIQLHDMNLRNGSTKEIQLPCLQN